jgi:hypothetical protein
MKTVIVIAAIGAGVYFGWKYRAVIVAWVKNIIAKIKGS